MVTDTAGAVGSLPARHTVDLRSGRSWGRCTVTVMAGCNLAVRLCVELGAYAGLSYWGATVSASPTVSAAVAVAAPLTAVLLWVRYLAPKARRPLHDPAALLAELAIFATAALALAASGPVTLATAFAAVATVNTFLVRILGRHHPDVAR